MVRRMGGSIVTCVVTGIRTGIRILPGQPSVLVLQRKLGCGAAVLAAASEGGRDRARAGSHQENSGGTPPGLDFVVLSAH